MYDGRHCFHWHPLGHWHHQYSTEACCINLKVTSKQRYLNRQTHQNTESTLNQSDKSLQKDIKKELCNAIILLHLYNLPKSPPKSSKEESINTYEVEEQVANQISIGKEDF